MGMNSSAVADSESDYDCVFGDISQTITQGPSTYHWAVSQTRVEGGLTFNCAFTGSNQASWVVTASGSATTAAPNATDNFKPLSTETFSGSNPPPYQQVVLTAGLSKFNSSRASSTGRAVSTTSGHTGGSSTATASGGKSTSKSSSGAMVMEPALALGAAGMLAVGLAAYAL